MRINDLLIALLVAGVAQPVFGAPTSGTWSLSEYVDDFTDQKSVGMAFDLDQPSDYGLVFSCEAQDPIRVAVFWLAGAHKTRAQGDLAVQWRVGSLPYHEGMWTVRSNDPGDALLIASSSDVMALTSEMESLDDTGSLFKIRGDGAYAEFPITGFSAAWNEFAEKCDARGTTP